MNLRTFRSAPSRRLFHIALLPLLLLMLSGCLEYREDLWLEEDGSGKIKVSMGLKTGGIEKSMQGMFEGMGETDDEPADEAAGQDEVSPEARQMAEEQANETLSSFKLMADGTEGLEYVSGRTYTEGGTEWIEAVMNFESLEALNGLSDDSAGEQPELYRQIIWQEEDGHLRYDRLINVDTASTGGDMMGNALAGMMFGNSKFIFTTHFPGKVRTANADRIDQENNAVTWEVPMNQLMSGTVEMQATVEKPGGAVLLWIGLGVVLVLVVLAVAGILVLGPKKKGQSA